MPAPGRGTLAAAAALLLAAAGPANASDEAAAGDRELIVTAARTPARVLPPQVSLTGAELLAAQPTDLADALRGLPGVARRTNSRGETIARVRGAEERQTAVFFEGAPLSVPWDSRVDLGMLPAGLIGEIVVTKGAVPIEFGANAVAGVVELRPRGAKGITALAEYGTHEFRNASLVRSAGGPGGNATFAAAHLGRAAQPVADLAALPFSQPASDRRLNTDLASTTLFGALGGEEGAASLRLSLLHNRAERGIAPESDSDPAITAPRYWRYPDSRVTQLTLNARAEIPGGLTLAAVGYRQWFEQSIESYTGEDYRTLDATQSDDDDTRGGRVTITHRISRATLRWSGSAQRSAHRQVDTPFPSAVPSPRNTFRQELLSLGAELDMPLARDTSVSLGAGYERIAFPLTGDKPPQPGQQAPSFSAALRHALSERLSLRVSAGRRTRFATARELFGEAFNRFLVNPALRPETAWLADAELAWSGRRAWVTLNPFLIRSEDTISQRIVQISGRSLRQRFNLAGSTTYGVDGQAALELSQALGLILSATALEAHADEGEAAFRRLVQRPAYEVVAGLTYAPGERLSLTGEVIATGDAVDLAPDGHRVRLPASLELNLRASLLLRRVGEHRLRLTFAADNVTDELVLPQLGLPAPGAMLRIGLRLD